jgi:hypothetical protein
MENSQTTKKNTQKIKTLQISGLLLILLVVGYSLISWHLSGFRLILIAIGSLAVILGLWLAKKMSDFNHKTQKIAHTLLNTYEKTFLVFSSIILTFLMLEGTYRIIIKTRGEEIRNNLTGTPFILDSNQLYQNTPFDYIAYFHFVGVNYQNDYPEKGDYYVSTDFESEQLNIVDGFRKTSFQPERYTHQIYIFGGSTVFCIETPDDYTLPSILQQTINAQYADLYKVNSRGIPAAFSQEELAALVDIAIEPGDIVIFYDGINEIFRYLMDRSDKSMDPILYYMKKSLLLNDFVVPRLPVKRFADETSFHEEIFNIYFENLTLANNYVSEHGGTFVHFLQPSIYSTPNLSEREEKMVQNAAAAYPGWPETYWVGYIALTAVHDALVEDHVISFDLQDVLDGNKRDQEVFIDNLHVNHVGNAIITQKMLELLEANHLLNGIQ